MISYAWCDDLETAALAEVEELLHEAAAYDAEAGFSTATPRAAGGDRTHHLLVRMPPRGQRESPDLDRLPDVSVVAYLRLDVTGDAAEAQYVVRPAFRSLGVSTLLVERLRDEGGWDSIPAVHALTAWAHGAHPAADRMARRFGATVTDAWFKTLRLVGGSNPYLPVEEDLRGPTEAGERPVGLPLPPAHVATLAPADLEVLSHLTSALRIGESVVAFGMNGHDPAAVAIFASGEVAPGEARSLLAQALVAVQDAGARCAQLYVDPLDETWLNASRELDFQHDQSDLRYELILGN